MNDIIITADEKMIIKNLIGISLTKDEEQNKFPKISSNRRKKVLSQLNKPENLTLTAFKVKAIISEERKRIFANTEDNDICMLDACETIDSLEKRGNEYLKKILSK